MKITIVKPDNLTIIDGVALHFDLSKATPDNLHALQWSVANGHIEFTDQANELIDTLPDWTVLIIEEHQRIQEEQQKEREKEAKQNLFIANGLARQERIDNSHQSKLRQQQQKINDYVLEKM